MARLHDWATLKQEFLGSRETVNEFRLRKKINKDTCFRRAKLERWREERDLLDQRAVGKAVEKAEDALVSKWDSYLTSIRNTKALCDQITRQLSASEKPDAFSLNALSKALSTLLQSERLIEGQSTENVLQKIDINVLLYRALQENRLADGSYRPGCFDITAEGLEAASAEFEPSPLPGVDAKKVVEFADRKARLEEHQELERGKRKLEMKQNEKLFNEI